MSLNNNTKWIYADISDYEERNILKINKKRLVLIMDIIYFSK